MTKLCHMAPGFTARKLQFAESLKVARKRAGMSQERAATAVGTSRRHWIRWESGETSPNPAYLERIASVLDAPELLESDEDEEAAPVGLGFSDAIQEMFERAVDAAVERKLSTLADRKLAVRP